MMLYTYIIIYSIINIQPLFYSIIEMTEEGVFLNIYSYSIVFVIDAFQ